MYQPYIRGKQFELIGLKELAPYISNISCTDKISPIIEPVKDSSTLKSTIRELALNNINFTIIINPQVGSFNNPEMILSFIKSVIGTYRNFQLGVIFHKGINHKNLLKSLLPYSNDFKFLSLIHNTQEDLLQEVLQLYSNCFNIKFNVINLSATSRRYYRNFDSNTLVEFDDYFKSQTKNSDYLGVAESNFSEEHLYYKQDGFIGFADFLTIGQEYSESGFLPRAVAIHISYANHQNAIMVKHFVSDNNQDSSDIAGKFSEALTKLINWARSNNHNTFAMPTFEQYYQNGHFPGLGTLKKLSLINHIDLVLKLI